MTFLLSVVRRSGFHPASSVTAEMRQNIDTVNDEMVAAGVRKFVGGLQPIETATSLQLQADGEVLATQGPAVRADAYLDGLWVLEVDSLEEALNWGKKAALACRATIEVRAFH